MGRAPCCDKANVKKGPWSPEEDTKLKDFIEKFGTGGNWIALPQKAGLKRCGKSCRLRWLNYLRPNIKHGEFSEEEDRAICTLYASIGSRWSIIAAQLPGRTDNDIKNYWNTKLKKKLLGKFTPLPSFSSSSELTQLQSSLNSSQIPISTLSQLYNSFYSKSLATINDQSVLYGNNNNNDNQLPLFSTTQNFNPYNYNQQNQDQGGFDFHQYSYINHNNPVKESNMLVFGGNHHDQGSCSSTSDGSYCSKDHHHPHHAIKQEEMGVFQGLISNGFQENQKFMLHYGKNLDGDHQMNSIVDEKTNVLVENIQLLYDLEVKQLISSSNNFLFSNDENKTHEKSGMYYYG